MAEQARGRSGQEKKQVGSDGDRGDHCARGGGKEGSNDTSKGLSTENTGES